MRSALVVLLCVACVIYQWAGWCTGVLCVVTADTCSACRSGSHRQRPAARAVDTTAVACSGRGGGRGGGIVSSSSHYMPHSQSSVIMDIEPVYRSFYLSASLYVLSLLSMSTFVSESIHMSISICLYLSISIYIHLSIYHLYLSIIYLSAHLCLFRFIKINCTVAL